MRFYVNQFRELAVEVEKGKREILIAPSFMDNDNYTIAADFLRTVAIELNELQALGLEVALTKQLKSAAAAIRSAELAERCLEPIAASFLELRYKAHRP